MNVRLWFALTITLALAGCKSCNQPPVKDPPKQEGDACVTDIECESGLCFALKGQPKQCKRKCSAGCKKEEVCTQFDLNKYGCVPMREGLCKACTTNSDCPYPADVCISVAGVKVCGRDCSFDNSCPESYHCINGRTAEGSEVLAQCQPKSATCECTALTVGQVLTCEQNSDAGTCLGSRTCQLSGYSACTAKQPVGEVCNGMDDNCNTMVDENLGDTSCGVGECKRTVSNCVNGTSQACVEGTATIEICNEKDDDCDGTADDGIDKGSLMFCGTCTNSCSVANGVPKCTTGTCSVDSCTNPFRDCDAVYSNGCEVNSDTSLLHCGACVKPCTAANATPLCTAGACTFTCLPGFGDLDKVAANGCEAMCTAADAPELGFLDTNCDGIDGIEANAIFVDALGGLDGNAGTKASPKRSIAAGISAAAAAMPKKDVYVSQGIYGESVTLVSGVSLYGSYNAAAGWSRAVSNLTLILSPTAVGVRGNLISALTTVQLFSVNAAAATGTTGGAGNSSYGVLITDSPGGVTLTGLTISNGNGAAGLDGLNGAVGAQGEPGGNASGTSPGSAGGSPCGAFGGSGASGVSGTSSGQTGVTGVQIPGGGAVASGGNPGAAGSCSVTSSSNGGSAPSVAQNGGPGAGGPGGSAGVAIGVLDASGLYLPPQGGAGFSGTTGGPGGGGGSGGGTAHGTNLFCTNCSSISSGGGGGGGGGGCPGSPGQGGRGGGGSFGVAALNSVVTLEGSKLTTGNGGKGGDGGDGASGGLGGTAGGAGNGQVSGGSCSSRSGGNGANGSSGGQAGQSGGGAGGTGGPSICVFYKGIAPTTSALNCTTNGVGLGGVGGQGFLQPAPAGPSGLSGTVLSSN